MKRNHLTYRLTWLIASLAITACSSDDLSIPAGADDTQTIELTGVKSHIITRAGDEVEQFEVGTKYWLHGVNNAGWVTGTEQTNHTINYGTVIPFSDTPMDFYGVTYGSTEELPEESQLSNLTITESIKADKLPDLMYARLLGQTIANGYRLEMAFKHATSKLKFMIVKQDESGDDDKNLENVKLKKIEINGTYEKGTLDIENGEWKYTDNKYTTRTAYDSNGNDMNITTTSTNVEGETLIFPNQGNEEITVTVTLTGLAEGEKNVDYRLRSINEEGEDVGVFQFEQNHEYTLLITVLKDDVRTIAIAPQVYEWIDVDEEASLGQPVTFANLMWMDRNLGAKSADCENDWENCRGYYYQYARNIPYILDKEMYDAKDGEGQIYQYLYTYNQNGEKVYDMVQAGGTLDDKTPVRYPNIAINPGDEGIYNFIRDQYDAGVWLYNESNTGEDLSVDKYWTSSAENHPCPKGWRLPTRNDFASFLPERSFASGVWYNGYSCQFDYAGNTLGYKEDEVHGTIKGERAIYFIKRKGRPDCYRIRILLKESKTPGKWYFEFAYFSGNATMTFEGLTTAKAFEASMDTEFDWSTPTAVMQVPACGFIHTSGGDKLDNDGVSTILRSSDWVRQGYNWVCYLRSDISFGLFSGSRKSLGDQIRCVRDVTVNKD